MQPLAYLLLLLFHQLIDIVNSLPKRRMREVDPRIHLIRPYLGRIVLVQLYQRLLQLPPITQFHSILVALKLKGALHDQRDEVEDGDDGRVQFIEERSPNENLLQMRNTLMRNVLPIFEGSRSSRTRLSCSRRRCRGKKERCFVSFLRQKYQIQQEGFQGMIVVPMSHLVAYDSAYLLDVQLAKQRFIDANEMLIANAVILSPMVIEMPTSLDPDLLGGKVGLECQIFELIEQLRVGDVLEVVEKDDCVGIDLRVDDSHHKDKDLKEKVIRLSTDFDNPQVAVKYRREGKQSQYSVNNKVIQIAGQCL